uniref:Uncharacterized protein n=1 Tax=Plectus sambesii TaxID=2011161 RepID=A0A914X140_9BILA
MRTRLELLLLLLLTSSSAAFCPPGCTCTEDDRPSVRCDGAGLSSIPILLNPRTRSLSLADNQISSVSLDELSFYPDLEFLDLSDNQILTLDRGAFFRLINLKVLRLNGNQIKSLIVETFAGLSELQALDISRNKLERLPTSVFADLHRLEVLNISDNALKTMSPGALTGLTSLKDLHLARNQLSEMPKTALHAPSNLKLLDLSFNRLNAIPNESFSLLADLEILKLEGNSIERIDENGFVGLSSLKQLNLRFNKLARVPSVSFRPLTDLDTLQLGENLFDELPTSAFEGLANLRQLFITGCAQLTNAQLNAFSGLLHLNTLVITDNRQFARIDALAFEQPDSLRRLVLSRNAIESLPSGLINWSQLDELDLRDNPWNCDCSLGFLPPALRLIYGTSGRPSAGPKATCAQPDPLQGRSLIELGEEDIDCSTSDSRRLLVTIAVVGGCLTALTAVVLLVFRFRRSILLCLGLKKQRDMYARADVLSSTYDYGNLSKKTLLGHASFSAPYEQRSFLTHQGSDYYSGTVTPPRTNSTLSRDDSFRIITKYPVPITEL